MTTTVPGTGFGVREARRADLLEIVRIEQSSFPQPWPLRAFDQFLGDPGFLVAERNGAIVGYIVANAVENHRQPLGHVKDLAVHPEHRSEGIATTLLQRTLAGLAMRGVHTVKLEVRASNEGAISLYRQHGFVHRHTVPQYYANGEDALLMVRESL